ncbi:hypothetical protein A6U87_09190 [Rhizobium sp. AC44/96]|uniref:STAS/SEC14 domain-containing protein n=1 Tax=Rhizobium sp. AC44/96 TaxID=1841654 RepID=UPI0008101495|nr:STAS/SEC14 domain-containing protein [Rhizobium sp. AC44/96]OCJ09029.1 hypothetical protein A6U87_09190 [Rhizobium sp. AC44/96]
MISVETTSNNSILIITPQGPLERQDFETIGKEFDQAIVSSGKVTGLMIKMKSFPGWENFEAIATHLSFVAGHHRLIERIAVATDNSFLKLVPGLASYFVHPKIQVFDLSETEQAISWLETGVR